MMVVLEPTENSGLVQLAEMELRSPRDQLRVILRQELERRGILTPIENRRRDVLQTQAHDENVADESSSV